MSRRTYTSLAGALARPKSLVPVAILASAVLASAAFASGGPTVSVTIKTPQKTLVRSAATQGGHGWITKGGTPSGKCSAASAAGALNNATHGRWTGKYYASVNGIFITSILGYKPSGSSYWEVLVDGKTSSKGICGIALKSGERLLFKVVK